jgi:hypothetical protein
VRPATQKVKGRSSASRTSVFRARLPIPVFAKFHAAHGVRSVALRDCSFPGVERVYRGSCKLVVKTKRARQRFSFKLDLY